MTGKVATFLLASLVSATSSAFSQEGAPSPPSVEARSAAEALQILFEANIDPGGPLRGDGAAIAGILAAQSLTFPVSSSSGAFATRWIGSFGPEPIAVSASGSFGPLFAERGRTNGRRNFSVAFGYQRNVWGTLADAQLRGFDVVSRRVYRNDRPQGAAGTADEFGADINFTTDVFILAANYGVTDYLDVGVSMPVLQSSVRGTKRLMRTRPQREGEQIFGQSVRGRSTGIGDVVLRLKANIFPFPRILGRARTQRPGSSSSAAPLSRYSRTHVALGADWRLATGATAELFFDCKQTPCSGSDPKKVPDLGLGRNTAKLAAMASVEFGRFSPHLNVAYMWVPSYECSRGPARRRCKGAIFEVDPLNNTQDAKDQRLSDEWTGIAGADYQLLPYRATVSFDVIARQIIRAGQFYENRSRLIYREDEGPEASIVSELESRHGNVNPVVAAVGAKVSLASRWVALGHVLFPLNDRGLQPRYGWVIGLERAIGR